VLLHNYQQHDSRNGACGLLEQNLEKEMLHLPYRHHMMESILASVFTEVMPVSSGPDVPIFKGFQQHWKFVNITSYDTSLGYEALIPALEDIKKNIYFNLRQLSFVTPSLGMIIANFLNWS